MLEASVAEARRAWVGIGPGRTRCAWPGTGLGGDDGGPWPKTCARGLRYEPWCRKVRDPELAGLNADHAGPELRPGEADLNTGVLTPCEPRRTDSDGEILTAGAIGVLTARVGVLACD